MMLMRIDLIVAGQGISKYPKISQQKNAWSTIGYTTKVLSPEEKEKLDAVLTKWTTDHQKELQKAEVHFNMRRLGGLAVKVNDFNSLKRAKFPMARPSIDPSQCTVSEESLRMTPLAGPEGISPVKGNRKKPSFPSQVWEGPIDQAVTASAVEE